MKRLLIFFLAAAPAVWGQAAGSSVSAEAERERIDAERAKANSAYAAREAGCYQRFAVTDCLRAAQAKRRDALAGLRRQEIFLNDQERKRKGMEQQRRIEERASAERQQREAERRAEALQEQGRREERAAEKARQRAQRQANEASQREARQARVQANAEHAATRAGETAAASRKAQRHDERVREAAEHKAERLRKNAARAKPRAAPLPEPSSP